MTVPRSRRPLWAFVASLAFLAVLFLAQLDPVSAQSGNTVTLGQYRGALEQARARIASAEGRDVEAAVKQAVAELAQIGEVEFPDGSRTAVAPLVSPGNSRERMLARLDAVIEQLRASDGENEAARLASLDKVLASDQMNPDRRPWAWLLRLLAQLLGRGEGAGESFNFIQTFFTIVGGGVLVFLLGRILQAAIGNFMREADVRREREDGERPTVAGARRRATEFAQAGSYREAVRQLYLATLLSLEDRGLLRIDRSLTNREVLGSVGRWAEVQGGLGPVVDTFETVWYGEREPDQETFERYSAEVESAADLIERAAPLSSAGATVGTA